MPRFNIVQRLRSWVLFLVAVVILGYYFFVQLQIQIVDANIYKEMVQGVTVINQPIKAVRGEILDRNSVPLVQNQLSYNIVIDRGFLPYDKQNQIILELINLFEQNGHTWIDNLPVSKTVPFNFSVGMETQIEALKTAIDAQSYTTAEDAMYWLIKEYKLEDFTKEDARKIAGVLYEMKQRDFSINNPYIFSENAGSPLIMMIEERSRQLPGVAIAASAVRVYPDESIAPHILGMIGPLYKEEYEQLMNEGFTFDKNNEVYDTKGYTYDDNIGKSGIEKAMENYLRGENGQKEILMDSKGEVIESKESILPNAGNNVILTIDTDMQNLLDESLEAQIKHLNETQPAGRGGEAHSGAAVVLNAKTGEVLAASTYPSYTISEYKADYTEVANRHGSPLISRAIQGAYTPGSTYKPVVALAGLKNDVITAGSTVFCGGVYTFYSPYTPKCLSTHGSISVHNAIGWSCNIFFYDTGRRVGIDAIDETAKALGLGEPTGIEIEEALGQRSNPAIKAARGGGEWYGADTIQTAIGQFDNLFSPLQLANYGATIGNRGTRMRLTMVKEVRDFTMQEVIVPFEPKIEHVMEGYSAEDFETVVNGMKNAMTGSAGGTFSGYPITAGCKTGTPQVTEDILNSTFVIFAPADDPEIAIAVIIEEGWQGYTGAPVAKAIMDDYFNVEHRGAVASGPQRLEDYRIANPEVTDPKEIMDQVFPEYKDGIAPKNNMETAV